MKNQAFTHTLLKAILCVACACACVLGALLINNAQNTNAFAEGTVKTVTATQKITATFASDGTITVPDTIVKNGLDYTITIDNVSIESQYSFISDWQCAGVEGKTLDPGKEMVVVWAAPSKVPTSFDGTSEVKVGTITYTYTYVIPNLTGKITIDGTPEVGQVLTAQVSDLPQDVKEENLAYTWYVVAEDGSLTPIEGANAKTYTVAAGYEGKKLTCVATDSTGYYTGELKADPVVIKSALSGSVSITQNNVAIIEAEATSELVASLSADVPADANPTYAWYVSVDGTVFTPIENATGATFTPDATYVGKYIQVRVSSANYTGVLISTNKVKITAAKVAFVMLAGDDTNGYDM